MWDTTQYINKSQRSGRSQSLLRAVALTLCIAYMAVSLLGAAYLLTHVGHEHDQDGPNGSCVTCTHITAVGDILKQLSVTSPGTVLALGSLFIALSLYITVSVPSNQGTLVKLKVRLNN